MQARSPEKMSAMKKSGSEDTHVSGSRLETENQADVEADDRQEKIDALKKRKSVELDMAKKNLEAQKEALMSQLTNQLKNAGIQKGDMHNRNKSTA